jgi:hypothetical protein
MKYSKKIEEMITNYSLHPDDVFFSLMVAAGASRAESAFYAYRPTGILNDARLASYASLKCNEKPNINKLITALKGEAYLNLKDDLQMDVIESLNSKEAVINLLQRKILSSSGREQLDILKLYTDLTRMKQEENKEEKEHVILYLPLRCFNCDYKKIYDETHENKPK